MYFSITDENDMFLIALIVTTIHVFTYSRLILRRLRIRGKSKILSELTYIVGQKILSVVRTDPHFRTRNLSLPGVTDFSGQERYFHDLSLTLGACCVCFLRKSIAQSHG